MNKLTLLILLILILIIISFQCRPKLRILLILRILWQLFCVCAHGIANANATAMGDTNDPCGD